MPGATVWVPDPAAAGPAGVLPPQSRGRTGVLPQLREADWEVLLQDPQLQGTPAVQVSLMWSCTLVVPLLCLQFKMRNSSYHTVAFHVAADFLSTLSLLLSSKRCKSSAVKRVVAQLRFVGDDFHQNSQEVKSPWLNHSPTVCRLKPLQADPLVSWMPQRFRATAAAARQRATSVLLVHFTSFATAMGPSGVTQASRPGRAVMTSAELI